MTPDPIASSRARRLTVCVLTGAMTLAAGCAGDNGGLDELRDVAAEVLGALDVAVEREPTTQRSKDLEYITADGTVEGDLDAVVGRVTAALVDGGWDVTTSERDDGAPAGGAPTHVVIAARDGVAIQVLVAATLARCRRPPVRSGHNSAWPIPTSAWRGRPRREAGTASPPQNRRASPLSVASPAIWRSHCRARWRS